MAAIVTRPSVAVWKFSSCDGCQLTLLDCEDRLLEIADRVRIVHFLEATSAREEGPFDISLVEGSISVPGDVERIRRIRDQSRVLVAIGACAAAGGIQALRNLRDAGALAAMVYPSPEQVAILATSSPIASHVPVDLEVPGCPISPHELLEVLGALLVGRKPNLPTDSVCMQCKARSTACVLVAGGTPCLGPVTRAGCGAICPAFGRGCYGCFGPAETVNPASLGRRWGRLGRSRDDWTRALRTFYAAAPAFAAAAADPVPANREATGDAPD